MRAMILAAGLGTRLRPLTDSKPKALVEVNNETLLARVIKNLAGAGVTDLVINLHHFPHQIIAYLSKHNNFGMKIEFSIEENILNTGGGLKKAASLLGDKAFFVHNVDIVTDFDLDVMMKQHLQQRPLATLAVNHRQTDRALLFDEIGLYGWQSKSAQSSIIARQACGKTDVLGFCGIHVISPGLLDLMTEDGAFSIIDCYLRLAADNHIIAPCLLDGHSWFDIGKPEALEALNRTEKDGDK